MFYLFTASNHSSGPYTTRSVVKQRLTDQIVAFTVAFVNLSFGRRVGRLDVPTYDRLNDGRYGVWPGSIINYTITPTPSRYPNIEITNFVINI